MKKVGIQMVFFRVSAWTSKYQTWKSNSQWRKHQKAHHFTTKSRSNLQSIWHIRLFLAGRLDVLGIIARCTGNESKEDQSFRELMPHYISERWMCFGWMLPGKHFAPLSQWQKAVCWGWVHTFPVGKNKPTIQITTKKNTMISNRFREENSP